jgi:methylenetetrahydrofolate dehydrogenase (NADP+)/methenyltetrahydrofolate cyclohydrolase
MTDGPLILDGKELSGTLRASLVSEVAGFTARFGRKPGLAVVIVGEDPASRIYVRQKARACEETGIHSRVDRLSEGISQEDLLAGIEKLNQDSRFDGILVQLPLPPQIREESVIEAISPRKDVDGFHPRSLGSLLLDRPGFVPCTPLGIMKMLEHYGIDPSGMEAVVIGRSHIVGKPAGLLLLRKHATVTICHSRTADIAAHTRRADLVVTAVGRAGLLKADMVKPGAVVIDVGINRLEGKKLVGDADFQGLLPVVRAITPVPGGVGPMTITMLLANTLQAARLAEGGGFSAP